MGTFPLTLATFYGVYVTYQLGAGLGAADGKIAVGLAGIAPLALVLAVVLQALMFLRIRLSGMPSAPMAGAVGFFLGAAIAAAVTAFTVCPIRPG